MKHAEQAQFETSDIRIGQMSRASLAPVVAYALLTQSPLTHILDKIASVGDRVRVGPRMHFILHPHDIDVICRKHKKHIGLAHKQVKMMRGFSTKAYPSLVGIEGEKWRNDRKILARHLMPEKGLQPVPLATASKQINEMLDSWFTTDSKVISPADESSKLFVKLAYHALFNQPVPEETLEKLPEAMDNVEIYQFLLALSNGLLRKPISWFKRFREASNLTRKAALDVVKANQESEEQSALVNDYSSTGEDIEFTATTIRMLMFASHTSMTYTLFNAIWNLAARPDLQNRITAQNSNDPILNQVIKETLRLNPAFTLLPKGVIADIELEDGYVLKKGDEIVISPYITHKDERFFESPDTFDPEVNFSTEAILSRPEDSFIAYGPAKTQRTCPGRGAAEQQLSMILERMCCRFEFSRASNDILVKRSINMMRPDTNSKIALRPRAA